MFFLKIELNRPFLLYSAYNVKFEFLNNSKLRDGIWETLKDQSISCYIYFFPHFPFLFNFVCIPGSFNNNISHKFFKINNNLCEFTTQENKFKRWFCTHKMVLNIQKRYLINKNKSDLVWRAQSIRI